MTLLSSNPLLVITVLFILSLVGAVVLFKLLKSMAIIKKAGYEAGGAVAGFLLIFGMLYGSFYQLSSSEPERWTVIGTAKKEKANDHEGIEVRQIPPNPTMTDSSGRFSLENVKVLKDKWPELIFESKNYFAKYIPINETTANIDANRKEIRIKDDIELPMKEIE